MKPPLCLLCFRFLFLAALTCHICVLLPRAWAQQTDADRQALAQLRAKAETGDAQSQFELGEAFYLGKFDVATNYVEAVKWFRQAANQNLAGAQYIVGATGGKIGFYGVTPVVQPAGSDQAAVTLGNVDGEIGSLTISDPPTQSEVQALRDICEELADDVRVLSTLVHALRGALTTIGIIKGRALKAAPPSLPRQSVGQSGRGRRHRPTLRKGSRMRVTGLAIL